MEQRRAVNAHSGGLGRLGIEPLRVCRPTVADSNIMLRHDPDPHRSEKFDPDPHLCDADPLVDRANKPFNVLF
jgi:hypothetical protein